MGYYYYYHKCICYSLVDIVLISSYYQMCEMFKVVCSISLSVVQVHASQN